MSRTRTTATSPEIVFAISRVSTPAVWVFIEHYLTRRALNLESWPEYCHLPSTCAANAISLSFPDAGKMSDDDLEEAAQIISALSAWSVSRSVFRFDPTLREHLEATPFDDHVGVETMRRLPCPCVYVDTPGAADGKIPRNGFFAYIDHEQTTGIDMLVLIADLEARKRLVPIVFPLEGGTLSQRMMYCAEHIVGEHEAPPDVLRAIANDLEQTVYPMLSLLLYLASPDADLGTAVRYWPANSQGERALETAVHQVGSTVGAQIRRRAYLNELARTRSPSLHAGHIVNHGQWRHCAAAIHPRASHPTAPLLQWIAPYDQSPAASA